MSLSDEIDNYYDSIHKLKHIQRKGWKKLVDSPVLDTIASHSLGAALLGWILAKEEDADENKIIKLLIIHDLVMAKMPDLTPEDKDYVIKKEIENKSINKLKIPKSIKHEFMQLFNEYQEEKTHESIIAREADKLDTLMQAKSYQLLDMFKPDYDKYFKTTTGKQLLNGLR